MMLTMAFEIRAVVLALDGIDEASGWRDYIQKLVLDVIVRMGQRLIATSRPEGVSLKHFQDTFVIIGLKPLDEKQAQDAINQQMQLLKTGREFSQNLLEFQRVRKEHDRIWMQEAFQNDEERARVEALSSPDCFRLASPPPGAHEDADGKVYDPTMRQHCADGSRVIQQRQGAVRSTYWKELDKLLEPILHNLDDVVDGLPKQATGEELETAVHKVLMGHAGSAPPLSLLKTVAGRLCLVAHSKNTAPSSLAKVIRARTDELYEAVEELQPLFTLVMAAALRAAGVDPNKVVVTLESGEEIKALTLAPGLKDPVRADVPHQSVGCVCVCLHWRCVQQHSALVIRSRHQRRCAFTRRPGTIMPNASTTRVCPRRASLTCCVGAQCARQVGSSWLFKSCWGNRSKFASKVRATL